MAQLTDFDQQLADFRALFPEFDDISDEIVLIYIKNAYVIFNACELAWLYLTAHLITINRNDNISLVGDGSGGTADGGSGETTSEKVGELQVTLKSMADVGSDTFYTTTPYGRQYLIYRNACPTYTYSARVY